MNSATQSKKSAGQRPKTESWEIETVKQQFPQFSEQQIKSALNDCKKELGAETARERMMRCVESKLK